MDGLFAGNESGMEEEKGLLSRTATSEGDVECPPAASGGGALQTTDLLEVLVHQL